MKNKKYIKAKDTIAELMGATIEEHHEYIYWAGCVWIFEWVKEFKAEIEEYEKSKVFWTWWKNQWNIRCFTILETLGLDLETKLTDLNRLQRTAVRDCFCAIHGQNVKTYPSQAIQNKIHTEHLKLYKNRELS